MPHSWKFYNTAEKIEVSEEEYKAEKEHRDWLIYRIRLDINNIKHWEEKRKYTSIWAERLRKYYKDLYTKYAEPELKKIEEKLRYWKEQREQHFKEAKEETERLRRKRIVEMVKIVEVTAYLNYVPKSLGGKGRTNEYKIIRWVKAGEEDSPATEEETYDLWSRVYFWFRKHLNALKQLGVGSLQFGMTNRIDWTPKSKLSDIKDWTYCLIIHPETKRVRFEGTANITKLSMLTEEQIEAGEGYSLVSPRNNIFYHNCPAPYTGMTTT